MDNKIICSFSGGETSGYMAYLLKKHHPDTAFIFANTGQEDLRTLDFVHKCDQEFGLNVVWLECVVNPNRGEGTGYKIVDYKTACRGGRLMESVIKKYGIFNPAYPHCTRELKLKPIEKWRLDNYGDISNSQMAIGIRIDEIDRISKYRKKNNLVYPLIEHWPSNKADVKYFWSSQSFRLGISEHEGNCTWCWKKTDRKLFTLIQDRPEIFDFPAFMEREHGLSGHNEDGNKRVFFRKNRSAQKMFKEFQGLENFKPFREKCAYSQGELLDFDIGGDCNRGCEVY